jgi:hypothetical protein
MVFLRSVGVLTNSKVTPPRTFRKGGPALTPSHSTEAYALKSLLQGAMLQSDGVHKLIAANALRAQGNLPAAAEAYGECIAIQERVLEHAVATSGEETGQFRSHATI